MDSVFDITYVPYFNKCQILEPDYVCSDTLMVIDHKGLNHAMAYYEQGHLDIGDYGLDSIMHTFCVPYSKTSGLQPVNFDTQ